MDGRRAEESIMSEKPLGVLVVEDNPGDARLIQEAFRENVQLKSRVEWVKTLSEASVRLGQAGVDVVLLDLSLPDSQGLETFKQVHGQVPEVPVVVLSGLDDETVAVKAVQEGAQDYIVKGQSPSADLVRAVRYAIERGHAQQALLLASIVEFSEDAIIGQSLEGIIHSWNRGAEKIYGHRACEVKGKPISILFTTGNYKNALALITRIRHGEPSINLDTNHLTKDGRSINVTLTISPIRNIGGQLTGVSMISRDTTERKQAEEVLERSRAQLRDLTARMEGIREEEKALIAREVHDELGQVLTGLKMDIAWLNKRLNRDRPEFAVKLQSMSGIVDGAVESVRKICTELRPGLLDDVGLSAAIEWQAQEFKERTGIQCVAILIPEVTSVDRNRSTTIFRIFQEALTNVARHAQATLVQVTLREDAGYFFMEVSDNGRGITDSQVSDPKAWGLIGMRERALIWAGELKISALPHKGTLVSLKIPRALEKKGELVK